MTQSLMFGSRIVGIIGWSIIIGAIFIFSCVMAYYWDSLGEQIERDDADKKRDAENNHMLLKHKINKITKELESLTHPEDK